MNPLAEVKELHDLNIELMDTLLVISRRFFEYCDKHQIPLEGLNSLANLFDRASRLCEEIGTPYHRNAVISDANLQGKRSDEDLTEPSRKFYIAGFLPEVTIR